MPVSTSSPFLISDQNKYYLFDKSQRGHRVGGGESSRLQKGLKVGVKLKKYTDHTHVRNTVAAIASYICKM